MTSKVSTFSLRLPHSLKAAVEKLAAITTAEAYFAERKGRGDPEGAVRFLTRKGGEPPRPDDQLPNC